MVAGRKKTILKKGRAMVIGWRAALALMAAFQFWQAGRLTYEGPALLTPSNDGGVTDDGASRGELAGGRPGGPAGRLADLGVAVAIGQAAERR